MCTPIVSPGDACVACRYSSGKGQSSAACLPSRKASAPSTRAFKYLVKEELEHALNTLNPREKEVLILRFGLYDEEPHTLEETGKCLHITRERARQIESKAMEKLRKPHTVGRLATALT